MSLDLTDAQKRIVNQPITKLLIMGSLFYMSTRNIFWSIFLVIIYFITINILLNETNPLNIIPKSWLKKEGFIDNTDSHEESAIDLYYKNLKKLP